MMVSRVNEVLIYGVVRLSSNSLRMEIVSLKVVSSIEDDTISI